MRTDWAGRRWRGPERAAAVRVGGAQQLEQGAGAVEEAVVEAARMRTGPARS
ncbi:hypothetical protein [Streptomyces sp. KL116D]|uniref:hypothetical protein n=1 Tax=Streptomyces sp. KL116D TaxID=3045152 RepID=UPI00355613D0